ncbi:MAG TPA: pilus assembly protein TadG-related protein [Rhizomicrobium sp.]|nr:pilus assembly protein TadG-related protein [Rhizomicrobium sp.]
MSGRRPLKVLLRDERGAAAPMFALLIVVFLGIAGFTVDIGHVMWVQRQLQTAADAAALAGATDVVDNPSNAVTLAQSYSATTGGHNVFLGSTVTTSAVLKCLTSVTFPTCGSGVGPGSNAIRVTESTQVPMWFSQILGIRTMNVSAVATASAKGGNAPALDILVVLDTTASMNGADNNCSGGKTKIACAKYGIQELLNGLDPQRDQLGVMVFPGYKTQAQANSQSTCSPTTSGNAISKYAPYSAIAAPYYLVAPLDSSFKSGSGSKSLNTSSGVVIAAGGGSCGQSGGLQAIGGVQTDYGQAILAAETVLANDGNPNSQKVIVFLSDGDANAGASNVTGGLSSTNECQQAVAASQAAAAQGMWVYSVAYGASTQGNSSCSTDKSNLGTTVVAGYSTTVKGKGQSACWTLSQIASDSAKFYSDDAFGCVGTAGNDKDLDALFKSIAVSLTLPRLIPNNAT